MARHGLASNSRPSRHIRLAKPVLLQEPLRGGNKLLVLRIPNGFRLGSKRQGGDVRHELAEPKVGGRVTQLAEQTEHFSTRVGDLKMRGPRMRSTLGLCFATE